MTRYKGSKTVRTTISLRVSELEYLQDIAMKKKLTLSGLLVSSAIGNPRSMPDGQPFFRSDESNFGIKGIVSNLSVLVRITSTFLSHSNSHTLSTMETRMMDEPVSSYEFFLEGFIDNRDSLIGLINEIIGATGKVTSFQYKEMVPKSTQ